MYPEELEQLIFELKKLPGVGDKTAERYALALLDLPSEEITIFAQSLLDSKQNIHFCSVCGNYTNADQCSICLDGARDHQTICVVATVKDLIAIERIQQYTGVYHVLGGLLSPQKGILPEDIHIDQLLNRVNDSTQEVILALNATVEGEMSALYIQKKLEGLTTVSRLAFGLPIGGHLDYADDMTLLKAFEGRK